MNAEALILFAGAADGWGVGLKRAGIRPVALAESEPERRAALRHHHPEAVIYDDVRDVTRERLLADLGRLPSVVVGSPPCQDVSRANNAKAKGVDRERSGLYFDFIRIVGEVGPDWYAAENSDLVKTRGYDRLHVALERVGYTCWPTVVGAREARFFHLRKRSWLAGVRLRDAVAGAHAADPDGAEQPVRRLVARARETQLAGLGRRSVACHAPNSDQGAGWRGVRKRISEADHDGQRPTAANAGADVELQSGGPDGEVRRRSGDGRHGRAASDASGQSGRSRVHGGGRSVGTASNEDALPPGLAAIEWAAQALGLGGRSRLVEHYRMADGVRSGLARLCISAYGDAVVTDIAETYARVMPQLVAELRGGHL